MAEFVTCNGCGFTGVPCYDGILVRHERGLGYIPYRLYKKIERKTGTPVREQMRKSLCSWSGKSENELDDKKEE